MSEKVPIAASPDPVDVHEALNHVRHLKEFQPTPTDHFWEQLLNRPVVRQFLDHLQSAMDRLVEALATALSGMKPLNASQHPGLLEEIFRWTVFALIFFGILILFYALLVVIRRWLDRPSVAPKGAASLGEGQVFRNAKAHQHLSQELAAAGKYTEAIHQLYWALLCLLDETGRIPIETSRTNLEYLFILRRNGLDAMVKDFRTIAFSFEALYFGRKTYGQAEYEACAQAFEAIRLTVLPLKRVASHV